MYNFVDVNQISEAVILPSEALCLNGEYIENLIPGYRTLTVEGREALSPELDYFSVGSSDGATRKSKRTLTLVILQSWGFHCIVIQP